MDQDGSPERKAAVNLSEQYLYCHNVFGMRMKSAVNCNERPPAIYTRSGQIGILQTAGIYSDASGKVPGWRSAVGLHCRFDRYAVYVTIGPIDCLSRRAAECVET